MQAFECFIERQVFSPINRCIYCGDTNGPFSDEHIIPYGLYGELILQKASCKKCSKITAKLEQTVLRRMWGATRIHLGLRTRRPKERPRKLTTFLETNNGFQRSEVPIRDHAHIMTMLELPPPKVLGRLGGIEQGHLKVWIRDIQGDVNKRVAHLGRGAEIKNIIPINEFGRLLAKIAHSYAVALLGADSFDPFLLDFILGMKQNVFDFVGGPDEITEFPGDKALLHQVVLSNNFNPDKVDMPPIIIADICLFSCFDAPTYQVVVGRSIPESRD